MSTPKWFEREFDLSFSADKYASIYARLKHAPERLRQAVAGLTEEVLLRKPGGKWSIKEHVGHLAIMEPLWRIRFLDIRERKPVLTTADLNNTATTEAGFNGFGMEELLDRFSAERQETQESLQLLRYRRYQARATWLPQPCSSSCMNEATMS